MLLCVFVGMCGWVVQTVNVCSGYLNSDRNEKRHACSGNLKSGNTLVSDRFYVQQCTQNLTVLEKNSYVLHFGFGHIVLKAMIKLNSGQISSGKLIVFHVRKYTNSKIKLCATFI